MVQINFEWINRQIQLIVADRPILFDFEKFSSKNFVIFLHEIWSFTIQNELKLKIVNFDRDVFTRQYSFKPDMLWKTYGHNSDPDMKAKLMKNGLPTNSRIFLVSTISKGRIQKAQLIWFFSFPPKQWNYIRINWFNWANGRKMATPVFR